MKDISLQNTIDAMTENVAIVAEDGLILCVNEAWREFSKRNAGHTEKTGEGVNYFSAVNVAAAAGDEFAKKVELGIQQILSKKTSAVEVEYPCHSDNECRWFITNITEIAETFPRKFLFTHKNVSSLVAREQRVIEAQRLQAIGQLTGGFAHDFNNLMGIMLGNIELSKQQLPANHTIHGYLDRSLEAIDKGASLVQNLLSFARNQSLSPEIINAVDFTHNLVEFITPVIGADIKITVSCEDKSLQINVDSAMLTNAILNLAINARHAMPSGGMLSINVSRQDLAGVSFRFSPDVAKGSYLLITVSDTGCGISEENINQVMEPFFTTKEVGSGSGLGLSMVYGFVKQSNGYVDISSRVGRGTTVSLYLPLENIRPAQDRSRQIPESIQSERKTVLLVEDNEDIRTTIAQMLESLNFDVLQAQDGPHALKILRTYVGDIDIVLADVIMPSGMSGIDLLEIIQTRFSTVVPILMSGYPLNKISNPKGISLPSILSKPFSTEQLDEMVKSALLSEVL